MMNVSEMIFLRLILMLRMRSVVSVRLRIQSLNSLMKALWAMRLKMM